MTSNDTSDNKCIRSDNNKAQTIVSPFRPGSNTDKVFQFLRLNCGSRFTAKQISREIAISSSSCYSALKRIVDKNYILKFKYSTFCEYAYPISTFQVEKQLWDITKGLPHSKMHNIRLYHSFPKHNLSIYGVEQSLGGRKGERIWTWGKDEFDRPIQRKIKWVLGYNKGKSKPPSIQITMSCTERPLSVPDDWIAFLIYLDGLLSLSILEHPEDWKLLTADFHTDYPLGPSTERLTGSFDIKAFTDALCRLYDKQIDGLWYRRNEIVFDEKANFAPTLDQWKVQQRAGVRPDYAQSALVGMLNTISKENRATRISQSRIEKVLTEQQKMMVEQQRKQNKILKNLAFSIKDLRRPKNR
ncbi:MAG: hypothetical protein HZR80_21110 [Candidatus Heimdallarchaeota archaeon]